MTAISTLTSKNQTTIPKDVVNALGLKPSSKIIYEIEDGRVILMAKTKTFAEVSDAFPKCKRRPVTMEEMDAAVRDGASARYRRSIR